jgi:hypothetical protein
MPTLAKLCFGQQSRSFEKGPNSHSDTTPSNGSFWPITTFCGDSKFDRFRSEADMNKQVRPAASHRQAWGARIVTDAGDVVSAGFEEITSRQSAQRFGNSVHC